VPPDLVMLNGEHILTSIVNFVQSLDSLRLPELAQLIIEYDSHFLLSIVGAGFQCSLVPLEMCPNLGLQVTSLLLELATKAPMVRVGVLDVLTVAHWLAVVHLSVGALDGLLGLGPAVYNHTASALKELDVFLLHQITGLVPDVFSALLTLVANFLQLVVHLV